VAKKTDRGRSQDRKRVAGGQDYEVRYEAEKTGRSKGDVKRAVKRVGTSRKKVDKALGRTNKSKTRARANRRGASSTSSKVKRVAKRVATVAAVAAGLGAAGTVLGELAPKAKKQS
jgi:hypothetical protein